MDSYTITDCLKGAVRGVTPSDEAIMSICAQAGISDPKSEYSELSERQQRLARAYLYFWIAGGPTTGSRWTEKDGEWSQGGGEGTFRPDQLRLYYRMANDILKDYGLEEKVTPVYGFRGGGIRNLRKTSNGNYI